MYYKVYTKYTSMYLFPNLNPYAPDNNNFTDVEGETMLFYTPNYLRATIAADKLKELGHQNVYIREFTIDEQIKYTIKRYDLDKKSDYNYQSIKFLVENSIANVED